MCVYILVSSYLPFLVAFVFLVCTFSTLAARIPIAASRKCFSGLLANLSTTKKNQEQNKEKASEFYRAFSAFHSGKTNACMGACWQMNL